MDYSELNVAELGAELHQVNEQLMAARDAIGLLAQLEANERAIKAEMRRRLDDHPADSVINEMDEAEAILNDDTPFPGCVPITAIDESGTTVAEANGAGPVGKEVW